MSYLDSSLVFEVLGAADPTAAAYLALQVHVLAGKGWGVMLLTCGC